MLVRIHILTRSDRSIDSKVTPFEPPVSSNTLGPPAEQVIRALCWHDLPSSSDKTILHVRPRNNLRSGEQVIHGH